MYISEVFGWFYRLNLIGNSRLGDFKKKNQTLDSLDLEMVINDEKAPAISKTKEKNTGSTRDLRG